jgi:hypothetical protein
MARESRAQRETVERVMREWKTGDLESSRGTPVKSQRQAVAIALHEAGESRHETPAKNRRNLKRTKAREAKAGETHAELYAEATRRGIAGRSRMTKAELVRVLRPQ